MKLTLEQAIILTGYTRILCCPISKFHEDAEKRLGRPIWTHEFGQKELWDVLKGHYKDDFMFIIPRYWMKELMICPSCGKDIEEMKNG